MAQLTKAQTLLDSGYKPLEICFMNPFLFSVSYSALMWFWEYHMPKFMLFSVEFACIHGLGKAITLAINLAMELQRRSHDAYEVFTC